MNVCQNKVSLHVVLRAGRTIVLDIYGSDLNPFTPTEDALMDSTFTDTNIAFSSLRETEFGAQSETIYHGEEIIGLLGTYSQNRNHENRDKVPLEGNIDKYRDRLLDIVHNDMGISSDRLEQIHLKVED